MLLGLPDVAIVEAPASRAEFAYLDYSGQDPIDQTAPLKPGEFRNPIIPGFHPDPSIVRVGKFYYLVNSTFGFYPGLPVFRSSDLVNWTQIGNAIDRPNMLDFTGLKINRAIFAPTIRHTAGRFYIINTCIDCGGNFIISAKNPAGPWSDPAFFPGFDGIDPDLFIDDDGSAWVASNGPPGGAPRYDGHRALWLQQLDLRTLKLVGERQVIVDGGVHPDRNPIWTEGPHIIKRDGWYYLFAAEGGTAGEHSETVYRARQVTGPYLPGSVNPILTQRDLPAGRPYPVYATGHADPVQDSKGRWWAVFLGTRPYSANLSNMGRETFLLPMEWRRGGWPLILPDKTAVPQAVRGPVRRGNRNHWRDDFSATQLAPQWLMLRTPRERWFSLTARPDNLTLTPRPVDLSSTANPSFLAIRQQHQFAVVETELDFSGAQPGDRAGLAIFADEEHHFFLGQQGGQIIVAVRNGSGDPAEGRTIAAVANPAAKALRLRITVDGPWLSFEYALPGGRWIMLLGKADGAFLASELSNQFTGTVIGPYASTRR